VNVQLDLFLDSHAVVLANEAMRAIGERDGRRAMRCVSELRAEACDYPTLPSLEILAAALLEWPRPPGDATRILSTVALLEDVIAPAARDAFGGNTDDVLAPLFRELAEASKDLPYDPSHGKAHRAWLSLRCGDWEQAEEAALAIPDATGIPDALHWLTVARHRQRGLAAARPTLFALAWRGPARLPDLIEALDDEVLERDYERFNGACEWANTSGDPLAAWFPAWYVLEHPAAAGELDADEDENVPAVQAARLVARILELERQGDWKRLVTLRDQLRLLNADLFALYMARREVSHWR
jgi:hypothetical protein